MISEIVFAVAAKIIKHYFLWNFSCIEISHCAIIEADEFCASREAIFMSSFFSFVAMIIFFVILAVFIVTMVRGGAESYHRSTVPPANAQAKATSKRTETPPAESKIKGDLHFVTFTLDDGREIELTVSPNEYENIVFDVDGELYYQETRFLSFEPKKIL